MTFAKHGTTDPAALDPAQDDDLRDPAPFIVPGRRAPSQAAHATPAHEPSSPDTGGSTSGLTVLYSADSGVGNASRAGGAGGGATTTVTAAATASRFVINLSWDASVSSAPAGFQSAVIAAAQYLESIFVDPVTINISVGYGEVNGTSLASGNLGQSYAYLNSYSYASLRNALATHATSSVDSSFLASLPSSTPITGTFWTTSAEAKAIGLSLAAGTGTDGFVGFSSSYPFTYNDSAGVASGTYDFNGTALHELSEVMGRLMLGGQTIGSTANSYDVLDLMHYSGPGLREVSTGIAGYSSADGGRTSLGQLNIGGGDGGDWASSVLNDSFDALSASGIVNAFSTNDASELDALGWTLAGASPPPTAVAPTGVAVTPITTGLAAAQTSTGLAGGTALAKLTEIGGTPGDGFTYALGGSGAAAFALSPVSGGATLSTASSTLPAGSGSSLYALTVTASDTTNATSSPASPLAVILGSAGNDTVSIATLEAALGKTTPTFVFALAGSDRIDGTGMTGPLWIDGGTGADVMTGGTGANTYLYASPADSTASAMDVITNFHPATDAIDLTGLQLSLAVNSKLKNGIAAHSIGWQSSNGNTVIYVNTSARTETLGAADLQIELQGSVSLGINNFHHL